MLFAERGFDGTSVDAIASQAGYNKSLLFQYFGDKLGLYSQVLKRSDQEMNALMERAFALMVLRLADERVVLQAEEFRASLVRRFGFQDPLLTQIGLALWQELEQSAPAGKLYGQAAAQMLAVHLLRHYTALSVEIQERSQGFTPRQMNHLLDFVLAHLSEDLSLDILAQQVGFSPYHFARLFRQTVGTSPHQFVQLQRIERAKHLLKETNVPLADVALESGFANQSHLTRVFKRYLKLTPRVYHHDRSISARL